MKGAFASSVDLIRICTTCTCLKYWTMLDEVVKKNYSVICVPIIENGPGQRAR